MGGQGRRTMNQSRPVSPKPTAPTQPASHGGKRPAGVQRMSRKTWDKVRQAIRALEQLSTASQPHA